MGNNDKIGFFGVDYDIIIAANVHIKNYFCKCSMKKQSFCKPADRASSCSFFAGEVITEVITRFVCYSCQFFDDFGVKFFYVITFTRVAYQVI